MSAALPAVGAALWLGILTSISPCPLATNIVAVSYLGQRVSSPRHVLWSGALYTAGRAVTYLVIAALLVASVLSAPALSHFLQKYMNRLLGPVLLLTGMGLLGLISPRIPFKRDPGAKLRQRFAGAGSAGAVGLGILFALAFCPVSAALFFGGLLPLALRHQSSVLLPSAYGVGTALPALAFALLIAFGARSVTTAYDRVRQLEEWMRRITGGLFLAVGTYFVVVHIFAPLLRS